MESEGSRDLEAELIELWNTIVASAPESVLKVVEEALTNPPALETQRLAIISLEGTANADAW